MNISVYITSYNQGDLLKEAIDSVLAQTLPARQIIVVDDCSSDGSQDVIADYARRHPGLFTTILHEENKGIGRTRIDAIEAVCCDYASHLDGDDKYLPRKLEMEASALKETPSARVAFSNYYYTNARGERTGVWADAVKPPEGDVFARVFARDFPKHGLFRNELVHYESWKRIGFYDPNLNLYEDYEMLIRMTKQLRVVFHDEPLSEYRRHDIGLSRADASKHLAAFDYIRKKNEHLLDDLPQTDQRFVRRRLAAITATTARNAAHQALETGAGRFGGRQEAIGLYLRSARDRPLDLLDAALAARILLPACVYRGLKSTYQRHVGRPLDAQQ
ncbi:glycosyltransferase [Candidatus Bipolaricaulota bacterium]|nr:glycosyltransferase [Candidatus Bipolaricaulota bacterium]